MPSPCCSPQRRPSSDAAAPFTSPPTEALASLTDRPSSEGRPAPLTGMVSVPAGRFRMGSVSSESFVADGEGPVRRVQVSAFLISATAVSNDEFGAFVEATGYTTEAERFGWSYVFSGLLNPTARRHLMPGTVSGAEWWCGVRGATWAHPLGPGSDLNALGNHPAVHVSWNDALAYADWRGARLPTEAEWERAARAGLEQSTYPWGDQLTPGGVHHANIWQGTFPHQNTDEDGYRATAPVDAFPPNGFGLHNMAGNVWEWTADWWSSTWHASASAATRIDPKGPPAGQARVVKGGSYLCHWSYCTRYRVAARTSTTPDSTLGHTGFRLAADITEAA